MERTITTWFIAALLLLTFAACNPSTQVNSTTGSEPAAASSSQAESSAVQPASQTQQATVTQTEEINSNKAQTDTKPSSEADTNISQTDTTAQPTQPVSVKPETKEQIVTYFNRAANRVKTEKPGYSQIDATIMGEITLENKLLNYVIPQIVGLFPQGEEKRPGAKKGADHSDFPVSGEPWASKLEAAAVQSAQCEEQGAYYVITIQMLPESLAELPRNPAETNHGKLFNTLSYAQIMSAVQKIPNFLARLEEFQPHYSGSYVTCKVEKDSGRMREVFYSHPIRMDVRGKVTTIPLIGVVNLTLTQDCKING